MTNVFLRGRRSYKILIELAFKFLTTNILEIRKQKA